MSSQKNKADGRVQFTLRLPPELHARLLEQAGMVPLNVYILHALEVFLDGISGIDLAQKTLDVADQEKQAAERKLVIARQLHDWNPPRSVEDAYEAGRDKALERMSTVIEQAVTDAVRKALKGKL